MASASTAMLQINQGLSIKHLRKLYDLLNSNEIWHQLGVSMDYTDSELKILSKSESPAEALITDCCKRQRNHKISDVYHHLIKIQFLDGVNLLKEYVGNIPVPIPKRSVAPSTSYHINPRNITAYPCPVCIPEVIFVNEADVHYHVDSVHGIETDGSRGASPNAEGLPDRRRVVSGPNQQFDIVNNWSYEKVKKVSNDFSKVIGEGAFGKVYQGKLDDSDSDIAIKTMLKQNVKQHDGQYQKYFNSFLNEMKKMFKNPHPNIVQLMAVNYQEDFSDGICLIYEYMPNGSVADRLICKDGTPPLTWQQRGDIAFGTAKGLSFLHSQSPWVAHGDIKPGNILLDAYFQPKIADFGIAKDVFTSHITMSQAQGTAAYLPTSYKQDGILNKGVDTYSYGITIFDLVTAQSPTTKGVVKGLSMCLSEIMISLKVHELYQLFDKKATGDANTCKFMPQYLLQFGKECTHPDKTQRPEMRNIVSAFKKIKTFGL